MRKIEIFDTTNRDGEQATKGAKYGIKSKLEITHALAKANVDRIEAGFPISSQADFGAVQAIARAVRGPIIFGLARTAIGEDKDVHVAYQAIKDAEYRGLHVFSVMFDPNSLKKYGLTRDRVVEDSVKAVAYARKLLGDGGQVEFSFQNATNTPLEWIVEDYKKMTKAGANVINVPDTVGYSHPDEIRTIISTLRNELSEGVMISIHCHNDLGLAVANSLTAVKAGADIIECTINGIGERAGNTALEEVVMNIVTRRDLFDECVVGVNTEMLNPLSKLVSHHYGILVQENKAIVGANAFRHRSGIHQDGMRKGGVYEIIDPQKVGWDGESYELTARSGYAGVTFRLERLGYDVSARGLRQQIMPAFKILADEKRTVGDTDLVCLMDSISNSGRERYHFIDMAIIKPERSDDYHANVKLDIEGKIISSDMMVGNGKSATVLRTNVPEEHHRGAIDAIYTAIDAIVGKRDDLHLVSYDPINIGTGSNAIAEVTVVLSKNPEFDGKIRPFEGMYVGRVRHIDTLRASAMAYVDALNKALR